MRLQYAMLLAAAVGIISTDVSASTGLKPIHASEATYIRLLRSDTAAVDDDEERWLTPPFISNLVSRVKSLGGFMDKLKGIFAPKALAKVKEGYQTSWGKMSAEELVKDKKFKSWFRSLLKYGHVFGNEQKTAVAFIRTKLKEKTILKIIDELDKEGTKMKALPQMKDEILTAWAKEGVPVHKIRDINANWGNEYKKVVDAKKKMR